MTKVYYTSARVIDFDYHMSLPAKLEALLQQIGLNNFVEAVRTAGEGQPFIIDTVRIPGLKLPC